MKIQKDHVVALAYELTVDGKVVDSATENQPLEYIHGKNMLIPRFEEEVEGKEPGEEYAFTLSPEEGYGEHNPKLSFDIPKESFAIDGVIREDLLVVGRIIPMLNSAGEVCHAKIVEVKDNDVTVDFNHPMAGCTLNFKGKVVSVREATEKELRFGVHGELAPEEECGCCGHHHEDGECCHEGHHHEDGECCHEGHHHEDGECCGKGRHGDGECCHHHDS